MAITKIIDPIPTAPSRSDPENFDQRADEFLKRLETLDEDLNEWADQCNQTQQEINQARDEAYQHKENAYKWASEAEDVSVNDGVHTGYSAYHWSKKAEASANNAATSEANARNWANAGEDVLVNAGGYQGYSAYHWAMKTMKGERSTATSNDSITIQTGTITININEPERAFTVGTPIHISYRQDPANYRMLGHITNYDRENNKITVGVKSVVGSGTFSDWTIGYSYDVDADTVDGFHASQTPAAGQIPALNASGQIQLPFSQRPILVAGQDLMNRTFYVDAVNGSDDNPGTQDAPFKTIKKAIDSVPIGGSGRIILSSGQTFSIQESTIILQNKTIFIFGNSENKPIISFTPTQHGYYGFALHNSSVFVRHIKLVVEDYSTDLYDFFYLAPFMADYSNVCLVFCDIDLTSSYDTDVVLFATDGYFSSFSALMLYECNINFDSAGHGKILRLKNSSCASLSNYLSTTFDSSKIIGLVKDSNGIPRNVISNIIL